MTNYFFLCFGKQLFLFFFHLHVFLAPQLWRSEYYCSEAPIIPLLITFLLPLYKFLLLVGAAFIWFQPHPVFWPFFFPFSTYFCTLLITTVSLLLRLFLLLVVSLPFIVRWVDRSRFVAFTTFPLTFLSLFFLSFFFPSFSPRMWRIHWWLLHVSAPQSALDNRFGCPGESPFFLPSCHLYCLFLLFLSGFILLSFLVSFRLLIIERKRKGFF